MDFVEAGGHRLEYEWIGPRPGAVPTLVFLHEGLGSRAMWKDFPAALAAATGLGALVYSRFGYGASEPRTAPFEIGYMHDEALDTLPEVLIKLGVRAPILLGHSDGGSIALIYCGSDRAGRTGPAPVALIVMAAHVFCEDVTVASIALAKEAFENADLRERLGRYHDDVESAFRGWNEAWQRPEFLDWTIEEYLPNVTCPVLAIQGVSDDYGTEKQIRAIERQVAGPVETLLMPECGHSPQRDQRDKTMAAITGFVGRLALDRTSAA